MADELWKRPGFLAAFRAGEPWALTAVYKNYGPRIAARLYDGFPAGSSGARVPGIRKEADHADAAQETWKRALAEKCRLAFDGEDDYWSYLSGIARNVAVDYFRRRQRRPEVLAPGRDSADPADLLARAAAPDDAPAHGYLEDEVKAMVREYIAGLPEPLRSVHDAVYENAMFQVDAAKKLGLSRRKVQKLLARLERDVRAHLERAGIRDSNVTPEPEGSAHG